MHDAQNYRKGSWIKLKLKFHGCAVTDVFVTGISQLHNSNLIDSLQLPKKKIIFYCHTQLFIFFKFCQRLECDLQISYVVMPLCPHHIIKDIVVWLL